MIIFFWLSILLLFIITTMILMVYFFSTTKINSYFETFLHGCREALHGCGFHIGKRQYPVELYKWVVEDPDKVCEECLDRATWPSMDIADWMSAGLPNTPEARTRCT